MLLSSDISQQLTEALLLGALAFVIAMALTPLYTTVAYRYKFWKRPRRDSITGEAAKVFNKLHASKHKRNIPTMAGVIMVVALAVVTLVFNWSREQTWLPLAATIAAGGVGLLDDIINIRGLGKGVAGLRSSLKFSLIGLIGVVGGWFFYSKLGYTSVYVPFFDQVELGWWLIPIFAFVVVATGNAVNISDGLDGLAGGLSVSAFAAFGSIAFLQGNFGLAGFCFTIVGALLSYVWFNIYPARFFMGDVGSFALGTALGVVAMLTDTLLLLPVIGGVFVLEAASSLVQILSKKFFKRKIFISAPIHHHFEASGWPETKVTMRFWVVGQSLGALGIALALIGGAI